MERADSAPKESVCTRTSEKSDPSRLSMSERMSGANRLPPPEESTRGMCDVSVAGSAQLVQGMPFEAHEHARWTAGTRLGRNGALRTPFVR